MGVSNNWARWRRAGGGLLRGGSRPGRGRRRAGASLQAGPPGERAVFVAVGGIRARRSAGSSSAASTSRNASTKPSAPRDIVLTAKAWSDLVSVNDWVNNAIKPLTDLEHWGVVEKWNYPEDGYGDCEDYALLKRRMLMQAGWPREALLITVVRDKKGDGHAVLTVKTDAANSSSTTRNSNPALVRDRVPLREAAVAVRSENLGLARRPRPTAATASRRAERNAHADNRRSRPGHVPTPPRPQTGFASGRPPPGPAAPFFGDPARGLSRSASGPWRSASSAAHNVGAAADHGGGFLVERADHARRRADDQRIVGKLLAFGDQRAGADQANSCRSWRR